MYMLILIIYMHRVATERLNDIKRKIAHVFKICYYFTLFFFQTLQSLSGHPI